MKLEALKHGLHSLPSPPSRGAWIEIHRDLLAQLGINVAPLAGGVD